VNERKYNTTPIHALAGPRTLGAVRVWILSVWLAKLLAEPFARLAVLPSYTFRPPGVLAMIPDSFWNVLLNESALLAIQWTTIVLLVIAIIGMRGARAALVVATALLFIYQGIVRGYGGHINHAELPLLFATVVLIGFPCFDAFALHKPHTRPTTPLAAYQVPLWTMMLVLCLSYTFVGCSRLLRGGLEVFGPESVPYWSIHAAFFQRHWELGGGLWLYDYPQLWPWLGRVFLVVTLFEIASPLALVSHTFRKVWLVAMLVMHVATLLLLNIFFVENICLMIVMTDLGRWIEPKRWIVPGQWRVGVPTPATAIVLTDA